MPIKHGQDVKDLLEATQLPKEVAILKRKAHTRDNIKQAKGLADEAAKAAAGIQSGNVKIQELSKDHSPQDLQTLSQMQHDCTRQEKWTWMENRANLC